MNREVEERIVAMYFDNQDFEKNAKTTIDTLGQLKNSLDLGKEAEKGFSVFEKIGKTLNFDKANQSLVRMKSTMSSMGNIFKKIFNLGPLDNAYRALDQFKTRYFDRVLGFDIAGKLVSSLENAFRSLTVGPISAGWDQYESKMDSVKTIMSSTGESMEIVEQHLQNMTEYANKTIYSLTDMTSNLGKFTNNGVKLEDAVKAMEGIANATADAGQGSQQASMAMYNISQAMGVGKMTTIDWKSLENANIATIRLKETFLDMAAAQGKLRKETKQVGDQIKTSYWLETDEEGKKLKQAVELNASNFREYLSKGWLDKETMLRTFMLYSGTGVDQNTLKSWGITDEEEQKRLLKIGEEAMEAATQVRTFTKMMDALKESVQSGWADSFQIIFGNMEQGTQLWTRMNDQFDSILSGITESRNKVLREWAETDENGMSIWTVDEKNNKVLRENVKGGRDIMIDALFEIIDVVKTFGSAVSKTFESVFGKLDGKKLLNLTVQFRNFVTRVKEWFGSLKDGDSRLNKLMSGLKGILNIIKVGMRAIRTAAGWLGKQLAPVVDWVIDKFAMLGEYFNNAFGNMDLSNIPAHLGKVITDLWNKIKSVFTSKDGASDSPFVQWIGRVWNGFKDAIRQFTDSLGLSGIIDAVENAWNVVTGWSGWEAIGSFFGDIWQWLSNTYNVVIGWFQPGENGEDSGFIQFLKGVASGVSSIWGIISNWEGWTAMSGFFSDIWSWITGKAQDALSWFQPGENGEDSGFVTFLNGIAEGVSGIWGTISNWEGWESIKNFFIDIWSWITGKAQDALSWFQPGENGEDSGFIQFLNGIAAGISGIWGTVANWEGWEAIKTFFSDTWVWITGKAQDALSWFRMKDDGTDSGFVTFLKNLAADVSSIWGTISNWSGWKEIGNFFSDIWGWITGGSNSGSETVAASGNAGQEEKSTTESLGFFERMIGAIGSFFEKAKGFVTQSSEIQALSEFLAAAGDFFKGVLHQLSIFLQSLGNIFNGKSEWTDWTNILGVVLPVIIVKIAEFFNNKHLSKLEGTQNYAQKFLEVAGGLALISVAVSVLTTLDPSKMWTAVAAISVLGAVVAAIIGVIAKLKKSSTDAPVTSGERILNNLISTLGKVGMIAVALAFLPNVIKAVGEAKAAAGGADIGNDLLQTLLGLTAFIAGVSLALAAIQKIAPSGLDPAATGKTFLSIAEVMGGFAIIALAFGGIGEAADGIFGENSHEAIIGAMNKAADFFQSLGNALGSFFMGLFGIKSDVAKTKDALSIADQMAEAAKAFDAEKIAGITSMTTLITQLSDNTVKVDTGKMTKFAEGMGKLGEGIAAIGQNILMVEGPLSELKNPESDSVQKLKQVTIFVKDLADAVAPFGDQFFSMSSVLISLDMLADPSNLPDFISNLNAIITGFSDLKQLDTSALEKIPSISSIFNAKGWMDFRDENGNEIDLLGEVQRHLTELGETLSTMDPIQIRITPVFDYSNLTPEAIQAELNNRPLDLSLGTDTKEMKIDFSGLDRALDMQAIRNRLDNVVSAIATYGNYNSSAIYSLAGHMDGIADEVARLKLVLDTGVLVGEITPMIDRELGERASIAERTGATPM